MGDVQGLKDSHGRVVDYMRLAVTERCDLRCRYCGSAREGARMPADDILRFDEFVRVAALGGGLGLRNIRLTGGEPLMRPDIVELTGALSRLSGSDLSMTTNGQRLASLAAPLAAAGLKRVNIGLPSLDSGRYRHITGGGRLAPVIDGIHAALSAGLTPVKINVVLLCGVNDNEIRNWLEFMSVCPVHVRFIEYMPARGGDGELRGVSTLEVACQLENLGLVKTPVIGLGPAVQYAVPGDRGTVGLISSLSDNFCCRCNRLRISATGQVRPCLLSARRFDVRSLLRAGASDQHIERLLREAVVAKPESGNRESDLKIESMRTIGG